MQSQSWTMVKRVVTSKGEGLTKVDAAVSVHGSLVFSIPEAYFNFVTNNFVPKYLVYSN
jgi:hypothetical protein